MQIEEGSLCELTTCHKWNKIVKNIFLLREETNRKKWSMGRVITIKNYINGFSRSVDIVFGTNASKTFKAEILKRLANKPLLLFGRENENNIEQLNITQDEISWGEKCV